MNGIDHPYLRLSDLRRLRHVVFAARRPVEGLYAGRHVSPQRGHSVEFTDFRPYMPGDEIGDIDWKIFGRSDKLFVKLFEHQSDMTVHLVLDASASMGYAGLAEGTGAASKYDHAARMAAAIAFLITQQQDRVSFTLARRGLGASLPPGRSFRQLTQILAAMRQPVVAGEPARLADALEALAGRVGRRGLVVVLSDLMENPEPILAALARFSHRGTEAIVFQVLHRDELELPDADEALMIDSETGQKLAVNLEDLREDYRQRMQAFLETWSTNLRARGIDHNIVTTAADYTHALQRYLFARGGKG